MHLLAYQQAHDTVTTIPVIQSETIFVSQISEAYREDIQAHLLMHKPHTGGQALHKLTMGTKLVEKVRKLYDMISSEI